MDLPPDALAVIESADLSEWSNERLRAVLAACALSTFTNDSERRTLLVAETTVRAELAERAARARHRQSQIMQFCILAATLLTLLVTLLLVLRPP